MSNSTQREVIKTKLTGYFPEAYFQGELPTAEAEVCINVIGLLLNSCLTSLGSNAFYPNPEINTLFTTLADKICYNDGISAAVDVYLEGNCPTFEIFENGNHYLIYLPQHTPIVIKDNPIGFMTDLICIGKLIEGYQALYSDPEFDQTKIDTAIKPYMMKAYRAQLAFVRYFATYLGIDFSNIVAKIHESMTEIKST